MAVELRPSRRVIAAKRMAWRRFAALVLATMWALCGADEVRAEGRASYGGTILGSLLSEPASFDPLEARSHAEVSVSALIFDTLYRVNAAGQLEPHLAASLPTYSRNQMTARISLVPGVLFHDGKILGAADVAASLRRVAASQRAGWIMAGVRSVSVSGRQVVLKLRRSMPELAMLLTSSATGITPGGIAPRLGHIIGSGPFVLAKLDRGQRRVRMVAFDNHFSGRAYVDVLELHWYKSAENEARRYERGLANMSLRGAAAFSGHRPKYATASVEGPATLLVYAGFGAGVGASHRSLMDDRDFRRALSLAISRDGFRRIGSGERVVATIAPAPVDLGGASTERGERAAQLPAARRALALAAGRVPALGAGAKRLDLEVIIDETRHDDREVAEKVVAALYRLGLRAHIVSLPALRFAARVRRGACDLYIGQLVAEYPRAELVTAAAFAAAGDNWTKRMLGKSRLLAAGTRTWFKQRLPLLPLFHRSLRLHYRRELRGVGVDSAARVRFADLFSAGRSKLTSTRRKRGR